MCLCCVCGVFCVCVCVSQGLIQLTCGGNLSLAFISTELAITCVRAGGRGVGGETDKRPLLVPHIGSIDQKERTACLSQWAVLQPVWLRWCEWVVCNWMLGFFRFPGGCLWAKEQGEE